MSVAGHHLPIWFDEATGPANGDVSVWNAATGRFESAPVTDAVPPGAFVEPTDAAAATIDAGRQSCQVFNPTVTVSTLSDSASAEDGLIWVANPSIAVFNGLFYVLSDANTLAAAEGQAGQKIYMRTSPDAVSWSAPFLPFQDAAYASNPVTDNGVGFQPNLMVVGDELWCTWANNSRMFLSRLGSAPGAKWLNGRFEFIGREVSLTTAIVNGGSATPGRSLFASFDGQTDWGPFPASNPAILADGTVAVPMTFQSASIDPASPADAPTFFRTNKADTIFFTSDGGTAWWMSETITNGILGGPASQWEPTIWEAGNGDLCVYSRLDVTSLQNQNALLFHRSPNRRSWIPGVATGLEVPVSRPYVQRLSDTRWLMTHCDFPHNDTGTTDAFASSGRQNGSLFVSRRGVDDFAAGLGWSGDTINQSYPQFCVEGGKIFVVFTEDRGGFRSLKLATIDDVPTDEGTAYVYPRRLSEFLGSPPTLLGGTPDAWNFSGSQKATASAALASTTDISGALWFLPQAATAAVIDNRVAANTNYGWVLSLASLSLASLNFNHGITISNTTPGFYAFAVDNAANKVSIWYAAGGATSLTRVDTIFRSLLLNSNPANNDTILVNGTTFTFKTSPSAGTDVAIGASASLTAASLVTVMNANGLSAATPATGAVSRVLCIRTDRATFAASSGTAAVSVEAATPVDSTGAPRFGLKTVTASTLGGYVGSIYEGRIFRSTLTAANVTYLYNALADDLGFASIAGTATNPGAPDLLFDPASTSATFPDLATMPATATDVTVDGRECLRLNGEASALVELPFEATVVTPRFKLSALPTGAEKWTIAFVGTRLNNVEVYILGTSPYDVVMANTLNGSVGGAATVATLVDPTAWNMIDISAFKGYVACNGTKRRLATAARFFLGTPLAPGLLTADKHITYDVELMSTANGYPDIAARMFADNVEQVTSSWLFSANPVFSGNPAFTGTPTFVAGSIPQAAVATLAADLATNAAAIAAHLAALKTWYEINVGRVRFDANTATTTTLTESGAGAPAGANGGSAVFYLNPADFPGATPKLRIRATVITNATAPAASFTIGLYPVASSAGGVSTVSIVLGTVISGSTAAVSTPALNTQNYAESTEFACPTAGFYALAIVIDANMAALSSVAVRGSLQAKALSA